MAYIQNPYAGPDPEGFQKFQDENYRSVLAGYQQQATQQQTMADMVNNRWNDLYQQQAGYGQSQRAMLDQSYGKQLGEAQASLANRGLWNTSVYDSATRGVNQDRNLAMLTLEDQLAQRQNAIKQQQLGWQGGVVNDLSNIYGQRNQYLGGYQQQGLQLGIQQGIDYNQRVQQQRMQQAGLSSQEQLQANQLQNQLIMQQNQFKQQDYIQKTYGY